ncbi:DUF2815 family protein [Siphonobacter curvatus]|uniref:DUF2815 domain-containing protein n=1 Tax=Siphonobacter curvatus TaxID=2094562 RepID=A0A2S7IR15_9BACT|nr:DUF2815 family protein [Siphonobacter curvatus]PQA60155.1 DUF2815 domain-containing protein [Siphonobacter curvatus]
MATKVVTGLARLSYAHVWEPQASVEDGGKPKYSTNVIISKDDTVTIAKIKAAIDAEIEAGMQSKFQGKINKAQFHNPLRDGDIERPDDPTYENAYFLNASSTTKPYIVDRNVEPILDRTEVYSGCNAKVSVNFYPFAVNGKKGIGCGLNGLQKISDGEPLGGTSRAEDDFQVEDSDGFVTPKSSNPVSKKPSIWD